MTDSEKSNENSSISITLHLPFPVSVNRIWRGAGKGVYRSAEYLAWKAESEGEFLRQKKGLPVRRIEGEYHLRIQAKKPDKRRRDLGNLEKVISDFLQDMGVIEDDCLSQSILLEWRDDLPAPTVVTVTKK